MRYQVTDRTLPWNFHSSCSVIDSELETIYPNEKILCECVSRTSAQKICDALNKDQTT